jgi:non-heme chloroperoxidase
MQQEKMTLRTHLFCIAMLCLAGVTVLGNDHAPRRISEGRATTRSGISIHYLQAGPSTSNGALVLIPGWRLPAYLWTEQLETFSNVTRVIALDPRSQGESTKMTEGNSPESRARDLHDLLATLGVAHPVLVGWSQGAQDVAAYVQQFGGDSVAGVVFVDSPVSIGPAEIETHREFSKIILSGIGVYAEHPEQYSRGMVESLFKQPHPDLDIKKLVESTLKTPTDIGIAMLVMDIFGADRSAALAKLGKPALVIASASSPLLDLQKAMAAGIPGAQFVAIEGAGHAVFIDQPRKFDDTLKTFLQAVNR